MTFASASRRSLSSARRAGCGKTQPARLYCSQAVWKKLIFSSCETRRKGSFRSLLVLCATFLLAARIGSAQDSEADKAAAKAAFEQGVADYTAGRYAQALVSFEHAYQIRPHPLVNVNIANCYDRLGKPLQAIATFKRFLESDAGTPEQRQEVKTAIERLEHDVGRVLLRITPDGASVVIDQGAPMTAPLPEPVELEAGSHALVVGLEGYRPVQRTLIVKGATTLELRIALEREAPVLSVTPQPTPEPVEPVEPTPPPTPQFETAPPVAPPPPASPAPAEAPAASTQASGGVPTGVWIAGGATLGLTAAAIVTGVLALGADKDFKHYRAERFDETTTSTQRETAFDNAIDAADRARSLALATDVMFGAAAIGAVITVYLIATRDSDSPDARASAQLAPLASPRELGLQLNGRL